ncbi:MAG: diacylglycerol kinase family lipid kinase [Saprospiraceae bacterium]|nr:diacylglycerol kinase family lipid kinase [Saprospiraceae bacterium]
MSKLNGKWFVVVNPAGGAGKVTKVWPLLSKQLTLEAIDFQAELTREKGHAIQLVQEAINSGFRKIIAVGGDGTLNETVNGIMLSGIANTSEISLALFPVGTGNDWIKTWSIPRKMDRWIQMLKENKEVIQDIGLVQYELNGNKKERYFANVAGLAYDAFVVEYAEGRPVKRWSKIFFLFMVMRCLFMYRYPTVTVNSKDFNFSGKVYTINLGICKYSGGGMQIVPHADPLDGLFALTLAKPISKLGVILNTWRFYSGTIGKHKKVLQKQVSSLNINDVNGEVKVEVDGELLGGCPCNFSIISGALKIIVP